MVKWRNGGIINDINIIAFLCVTDYRAIDIMIIFFLFLMMFMLSVALQTVVPLSQCNSQLQSIKGEIQDVSAGVYLLVFDNTFSR